METKWKMEPIIFKHPDNPIVVLSNLVDFQNKEKAVLSRLDEVKMEHPRWLYYIISLTEGADSSFIIGQPLGIMAYSKLKKISENMEKHAIVHVSVSPVVEGSIKFTLKDDENNGTKYSSFTLIPNYSESEEPKKDELAKEDIEAAKFNNHGSLDFWTPFILGSLLGSALKNNIDENSEEEDDSEDD